MLEKIKAFFGKPVVKIIAWVVLALSVVALVIGGVTQDTVSSFIVLVFAIIAAVSGVIAFIASAVKKS